VYLTSLVQVICPSHHFEFYDNSNRLLQLFFNTGYCTMAASAYPLDFSAPWKFSDVALVVEGQKFHVHQVILSLWSRVFEKMFTSEFREKSENEIPFCERKQAISEKCCR